MAKTKTTAKAAKRKSTPAKARKQATSEAPYIPLVRCVGHDRPIRSVAWSPDGTRLASGSTDGTIRLWDAATGEEILRLVESESELPTGVSTTWSQTGDALVASSANRITVWDVATGSITFRDKATLSMFATAVRSADDQTIIASGRSGIVAFDVTEHSSDDGETRLHRGDHIVSW